MQLQFNSCADELDLSISNQSSSDQCKGGGTSRLQPAERITTCRAGPYSRVSVRNSDLMMVTSARRENSGAGGACNPSADLNDSLHLAVNRHEESPLSSRQPRMIFSSTINGAAADHERGGWSPRCYACSFCGREFNSAQALGGHMNIHRRDRARLRTSTSPAALAHDQADLPPNLQSAIQYSPPTCLYDSLNEAAFRENPAMAISSSLNVTYPAPSFSLLDIRPAAPDPTLLALAAYPSPDENLPAPFSVPLVDVAPINVSTRHSSSAVRFSKAQSEAQSLFSSIAPHASLFVRPRVENSSLKHEESLNMNAGQESASRQGRPDCEAAASRAQLVQFASQAKGRAKRARVDEAADGAAAKSTAGRSCRQERSCVERSNSLDAARPLVRASTPKVKGLLCLDLELRLGQSSPSDSVNGADDCCRPTWTRAKIAPAPRPPS